MSRSTSNSIQDGGVLVVNILVFDLRVQLQHCTYQRELDLHLSQQHGSVGVLKCISSRHSNLINFLSRINFSSSYNNYTLHTYAINTHFPATWANYTLRFFLSRIFNRLLIGRGVQCAIDIWSTSEKCRKVNLIAMVSKRLGPVVCEAHIIYHPPPSV